MSIDIEMLLCFAGKVCSPLWPTWEASLGEGKPGVEVGTVNPKVARQTCARQTLPKV